MTNEVAREGVMFERAKLAGYVDARYSRRNDASREALRRPYWLRSVADFLILTDCLRTDQGERPTDIATWLGDTSAVISESLRLHSLREVDQFQALTQAIVRFWPHLGYSQDDAKLFVGEAVGLMRMGIVVKEKGKELGVKPETICALFDSLLGICFLDQTISRHILSPKGLSAPITALEGLDIRSLGEGSKARSELLEGAVSVLMRKYKISHEEALSLADALVPRKIILREKSDAISTLANFAAGCTREFEARSQSESDESLRPSLEKIAKAARRMQIALEIMIEGGKQESEVLRPVPPQSLLLPISAAIADSATKEDWKEKAGLLIKRITLAIRRRRMGLDWWSVMDLCSAFQRAERISDDAGIFPEKGKGLEMIGKLLKASGIVDEEEREKILDDISEYILPLLILHIRLNGYHDFQWTNEEYRKLGLSKGIAHRHNSAVLKRAQAKISGIEEISSGEFAAFLTGNLGPLHSAHEAVLREVAEIPLTELTQWGLLQGNPQDFLGYPVVGIGINAGDPKREGDEVDYDIRKAIIQLSLQGCEGVYFLPKVPWGPTVDRITGCIDSLDKAEKELVGVCRVVGAEKLDESGGYSEEEEPEPEHRKWLHQQPHIILLQMEDLSNFAKIFDRLQAIFNTFKGRVVVFVVQTSEIHGAFVRSVLGEADRPTLTTMVHPAAIPLVIKHFQKEREEK